MINSNSQTIYLLTGWLPSVDKDNKETPLSNKEWNNLAAILYKKGAEPQELKNISNLDIEQKFNLDNRLLNRIKNLTSRSGQLMFELEKYLNQGYKLTTRAESNYPKKSLPNLTYGPYLPLLTIISSPFSYSPSTRGRAKHSNASSRDTSFKL